MLVTFVKMARARNKNIETCLTVEESGNTIAMLQGEVLGFNVLIEILKDKFPTEYALFDDNSMEDCLFKYQKDSKMWFFEDENFNKEEVSLFRVQAEQLLEDLEQRGFFEEIEKRIAEKKDWLFYESEKGRDIYYCHGFYKVLTMFQKWIDAIFTTDRIRQSEMF